MSKFDIANAIDRDVRLCKAHAFAARLFAGHPLHRSNRDIWENVARAWDDLAHTKERLAQSDTQIARAAAYVTEQLRVSHR